MSEIYKRIKSRRLELGWTTDELAKRMGYKDRSSISKIENGKADIPQSKVKEFAEVLDTSVSWLIGIDDEDNRSTAPAPRPIPKGFEPMPKMKKIPLVGSIACGTPILAQQNIDGHVDAPEDIRCDFALRCKGDSMIGAGIHDGDAVYIHIQPEVENGEIAAVRIGEEATLKRVYYDGTTLTLMPYNNAYAPMVYTGPELNDVQIEGKAVGWTHWVG